MTSTALESLASSGMWAATSAHLVAYGGAYCADCRVSDDGPPDDGDAARLWALSAELTGLDLPGTAPPAPGGVLPEF